VTFLGDRLIVLGMETTLFSITALVVLLALSWYLLSETKRTRGPGSWATDRLMIWLSGAAFAVAVMFGVQLIDHLFF
jgi:cyanate permease